MSRITQIFPSVSGAVANTVNHAGGAAYQPDIFQLVAELLLLGTFNHTFYASGEHWAQKTQEVCLQMAMDDPLFLAQAAVLARTQGYVRSAPLVALMALLSPPRPFSNEGSTEGQRYGAQIFSTIIQTGDDLRNFVGLAQSKQFRRGYGGITRRLVAQWLNTHLTEYQAIKYQGSQDRLSLRNILRLTHPTPATPVQNTIFRWLVQGEVDQPELVPQIAALRGLAKGSLDPTTAITQYRLPFEAVMPRVDQGTRATWEALLEHAPYMFLLRSLHAMHRAGVWSDSRNVQKAVTILTDPARIHKAKQFPFRYMTAAQTLQQDRTVPFPLVDALYTAMEHSLSNIPSFGSHRVALAPDVSGSMHGTPITPGLSGAQLAGLFTGALWKQHPEALVLPFGSCVHPVQTSPRDSLLTISRSLGAIQGGGTNLSAPLSLLLRQHQVVDVFVGITDAEDWGGSRSFLQRTSPFLHTWRQYQQIAPHAQAVLIQLVPNTTRVAPSADPSLHYVYGWSDQVLRLIAAIVHGSSLVDQIRQVELSSLT